MISLCIKNNNLTVIKYLLDKISLINLDGIIFCQKRFSKYHNLIIHYTQNDTSLFYNEIADVVSNCIIDLYEPHIINNLIFTNYFYFDLIDLQTIEKSTSQLLAKTDSSLIPINKYISNNESEVCLNDRIKFLWDDVLKYITSNKSLVLDGFVNFRISNYLKYIDLAIDYSVNQFIIDKEYSDFINLLKLYISAKDSKINIVHLVYTNGESILLDDNKNIISITKNILDIHYLSDISFSSNDYALNSLLSLLPNKIIVHLISGEDEFINTLKLIFTDSVVICKDCNICKTYKLLNSEHLS